MAQKSANPTRTKKGILLDCDYQGVGDASVIRVFLRTKDGIEVFCDPAFRPYFYAVTDGKITEKQLLEKTFGERNARIAEARKTPKQDAPHAYQLFFKSTQDLTDTRAQIKSVRGVKSRSEHDIPFAKRYLIDRELEPLNGAQVTLDENGEIAKICAVDLNAELRFCALDIETYSPGRFPDAKRDPVMMVALTTPEKTTVYTTHPDLARVPYCTVLENEKAMLARVVEDLKLAQHDVLVTYNGDQFDLPYLATRAKVHKIPFDINADGSTPHARKRGGDTTFATKGTVHLDAYQLVRFLVRFQVINLVKYDLESVSGALLKKPKEKFDFKNIQEVWEKGRDIEKFAAYNREDAEATLELAQKYFPLAAEMCKMARQTLEDTIMLSGGGLVESLLMQKSREKNTLVPNRPHESEVQMRRQAQVEGAFVREPKAGIYEHLAMLDFRSFHPSIMIRHNISPETLDCDHAACKSGKNVSPTGHWFCAAQKGFITQSLKEVMEERVRWKKKYKSMSENDPDRDLAYARQWALKIALNSFFGYMGYPRSRWYCRECGNSILAWTRYYIKDISNKAEAAGFPVVYNDTDSCLVQIPADKKEKDVKDFAEKMNEELADPMELELEAFYRRGIFVTTKEGKTGAKKKYALMDFDDRLKIVGFEYVRRDWSNIAKKTQKTVIETILKEGKPEKAISAVKKAIRELRAGQTPKRELVIYSQIQKPLDAYTAVGPHVAAARRAKKKGKEIEVGTIVGYVITRTGKTISERAELEEYVREGDYDPDYYISNQLMPAVLKIMGVLGYTQEDLEQGGKQAKLF